MFEVRNLKDSVGSEIRTSIETLLTPEIAKRVRDILVERGIVVFKALNLTEDQQRTLSSLMGTLRQEGQNGVIKITLDKSLNARADYLKVLGSGISTAPTTACRLSLRCLPESRCQKLADKPNSQVAMRLTKHCRRR